jgi:hypothetical protein
MIKQDPEKLIASYLAGIRHPEVSGMEHLNLLQIRSSLADLSPKLTEVQSERLKKADQELLAKANEFLCAIQQIADLESWRIQENVSPAHWWWYLDVIINLPLPFIPETIQESTPETEAQDLRERILTRRAGEPVPSSAATLHELREERLRELP